MFNEKKRWFPVGLFLSMRIAFKNLFRPAITIRYPHVRAHIPERARWALEIKYAKDGTHRCTACKICEKECPNYLIDIDVETSPDRSKTIKHWLYRRGGCMMCGLCVEVCPFDAIKMGHSYELAHSNPDLLEYDLLTDTPAYKRPRPAPRAVVKPEAGSSTKTAVTTEPASPVSSEAGVAIGQVQQKEAGNA
ncbi:MAG: 4Fe-4S binding protein [Coriobacteriia bacterium]|nr:4Fe-4S binding protein [Coriobacteriia bacterium]MCL2746859.1 4Fe-4S binding protein [Coriobacteriia bacterium]MCL2870596.1 4Fe-4S binding protein [Coriobacteriia bacterium]